MFGSITSWFIWRMTFKINEKKNPFNTHLNLQIPSPHLYSHSKRHTQKERYAGTYTNGSF